MIERLSIAIGAAVALPPTSASAQGYGPQMMDWGGWGFGPIIGPIFMILVLAAVIAAVVLLVRAISGPQGAASPYQEPPGRRSLEILKERFARGEINKEEFEERRRVLSE